MNLRRYSPNHQTRSIDARQVSRVAMILIAAGVFGSLACPKSPQDTDLHNTEVESAKAAERSATNEARVEALLEAAEVLTRWNSSCQDDGHCVFERKVPVRDGRPDDLLILQVDHGSSRRPDLLVLVAPPHAKASAGIKITFFSQLGE